MAVRRWLRMSPHVHIREENVASLNDLVKLLDRFLDDDTRYPLEWDDFVSWTHDDPEIEAIRDRIADTEPLFFSGSEDDRVKGVTIILRERNAAAGRCGIPLREV